MHKNKLNVLITRPEKAGRTLLQKCQAANVQAWHQPLFSYQSNSTTSSLTKQVSSMTQPVVIFISVAAVEFAQQLLPIKQWQTSQVFAVGKATQQALEQLGIHATCPTEHTSEGLLQLPALMQVAQQSILVVRGDGGREFLAEQLRGRGANVRYLEVYRRQWHSFSQPIGKTWQQKNINCVVITSNALLESIVNLIDLCDNYWQNTCLWIVASERIAQKAMALGLKQVINAQGASDEAIMAVIKQYGME